MNYNGWRNYETWNANLWIDNDESEQRYWSSRASEILEDTEEHDKDEAAAMLAEELEEHYDQVRDEHTKTHGMFADLLSAALREIDWREIAEHMLEDVEV